MLKFIVKLIFFTKCV